jgi:hypothetical protein
MDNIILNKGINTGTIKPEHNSFMFNEYWCVYNNQQNILGYAVLEEPRK